MDNKTFAFGQRVNYDGHNGVSLVIGRAITDLSGNVTDDWWWVATPDLPSILTHTKNIEPIDTRQCPLDDDEIERLVNAPVEVSSKYGTAKMNMSSGQQAIARLVLRHVRERYSVTERGL